MILRDYQRQQIDQIWKTPQDSVLIQAPTGTGKGNQISHLLRELGVIRNQKVVLLVPTYYLVSNIYDRFIENYPKLFNNITNNWQKTCDKNILIVTYQSFCRHLDCFSPDWIIIDEAHISASNSVRTIINHYRVPTIGFTATPTRLGGESLDMYDRLILSPLPTQEYINQGYLADFDLYTIRNPEIDMLVSESYKDNLVQQSGILSTELSIESQALLWEKYSLGLKTIFFVTSRDQGLALKAYLNSKYAYLNYCFEYIDSDTSYKKRDTVLADFRSGKILGLINIELLILGVDVPDCQCVFTARATQSLTYWLQFVGRVLRPKKDKSKAVIIDPVGNALRLGSPAFDHDWSLEGSSFKKLKDSQFCCSECEIPLVTKNKVAQFGNQGMQVFCHNCETENWFLQMPEGLPYYQKYNQKKKKLITELERFEADQINWEAHKVISDPKVDKVRKKTYILKSQLSKEQKKSALLFIGEKPESIEFYLH